MPGSSRDKKAEAKYNVTTEFPHLGLHSAAATGNIGLVKYALSHGQPINSVIDGVLPLHAACSGGNLHVVKFLIDAGADVNAPRLPRRYSHHDRVASRVGTSGSTPLHFAAANGHVDTVRLLLRHGARPDRPDKHGVTPEALARQHGWPACADAVRDWLAARDDGLPPVPDDGGGGVTVVASAVVDDDATPGSASLIPDEGLEGDNVPPRRIAMKRSIDIAVRRLRSSSSLQPPPPSPPPPDSPSRTRRPSSASGQQQQQVQPRRLASKRSLLGLFRRPSADALGATSESDNIRTNAHVRSGSTRLRFDASPRSKDEQEPTPELNNDEEDRADGGEEEEEEEEAYVEYGHARRSPGDFPFSLDRSPSPISPSPPSPDDDEDEDDDDDTVPSSNRARGDSLSTTGSSLFILRTPSGPDTPLPPPSSASPSCYPLQLHPPQSYHHRPPEMNLGTISTHAQAEALVLRTQASVLELDADDAGLGGGAPLSARLAAYGESLAIARRLREEAEALEHSDDDDEATPDGNEIVESPKSLMLPIPKDEKKKTKKKVRRRPRTAEETPGTGSVGGIGSNGGGGFLRAPMGSIGQRHQHLRSKSAVPLAGSMPFTQRDLLIDDDDIELADTPLTSTSIVDPVTTVVNSPSSLIDQQQQDSLLTPTVLLTPPSTSTSLPLPDLSLTRVLTAPGAYYAPERRRANKLVRMGIAPSAAGTGVLGGATDGSSGKERDRRWGIGRWVTSLKGRS